MVTVIKPFTHLGKRSLFLIWGSPSVGPRSRVFSRELGIDDLQYVYTKTRRGVLSAPLRYAVQTIQTLRLLFKKHPEIVFVQSPPSLAVLVVYFYCRLTNSQYVIDAHSAAFLTPIWTYPRWLHRHLAQNAIVTIVTNEHFKEIIQQWGGNTFVLRDIPTNFPRASSFDLSNSFNLVVVNTFSDDEPIDQVLQAANELREVNFYITGNKKYASEKLLSTASNNVHFTDFLPDDLYYALLSSGDAVMCLTNRDHTMQRGACEALSLGKPIITSDWPMLRDYFDKGTIHVANTKEGICQGVHEMVEKKGLYQEEIKELQEAQRREWLDKSATLTDLVQQALEPA